MATYIVATTTTIGTMTTATIITTTNDSSQLSCNALKNSTRIAFGVQLEVMWRGCNMNAQWRRQ